MSGRTRGLTLIEILIVIGLLLGLAALSLPTVVQQLDDRAFTAGGDVIQRHLAMARAHAKRTGNPVEVVYQIPDRRMVARSFDVTMQDEEEAPVDPPLITSWSVRELPGRIMLTDQPPLEGAEENELTFESQVQTAPRLRVAVFLGDGSALIGQPLWLRDLDGRQARIRLNPFTGVAIFDAQKSTGDPDQERQRQDEADDQAAQSPDDAEADGPRQDGRNRQESAP
jgi:hypothetical protein